jgi:hypothetical protein
LSPVNFELSRITLGVSAILACTTVGPVASRQLGRIRTTVLLLADEAFTGLSKNRGLAGGAVGSAMVWGQTLKVELHVRKANIPICIRASSGYLLKVRVRATEYFITSAAFVRIAIVEEAATPR